MFDWIVGVIAATGLVGVALLMFAENVFPPMPSEVIMPLAGFVAAEGLLSFPGVVAAGSAGALAGASLWYVAGLRVRQDRIQRLTERHGRWLTLHPRDLERARAFFDRHGGLAVFLGRLIPGVRTLVSVPAGLLRMPPMTFLAWSALGATLWTLFLAGCGYVLAAQFHKVEDWLDPISTAVFAAILLLYAYRVATHDRREHR